jgi:uncharacterized RmlC-like cupin family protein
MLRVSKVEEWLNRPRVSESARPDLRTQGDCVIIRSSRDDGRRSGEDPRPGVSGPTTGAQALRLHLVMIPPGTRSMAHFHVDHETAIYLVSGEAEVWHGDGLVKRSTVRAGDFIYIPPGTPHLAVNRGDVTSIAVVASTDPADQTSAVVIELPRHLAGLLTLPVAAQE